ncbi:MAG: Hsp20/alpha crystallin family protein [Anaerolineales bacterium]
MTFYYRFPRRGFLEMREMMDRLLNEVGSDAQTVEREMTLATDVLAEDDGYIVRALIPGVSVQDLNVEVLNNTVSIRGEFKAPEESEGKYLVSELPVGRFARVITLPTALETGKVEASLKDGVLTLRIPKAEAHRPKAIEIKVA